MIKQFSEATGNQSQISSLPHMLSSLSVKDQRELLTQRHKNKTVLQTAFERGHTGEIKDIILCIHPVARIQVILVRKLHSRHKYLSYKMMDE